MAKADMPNFTVREMEMIANLVVGRHDSLVELDESPYMMPGVGDKTGLKKAIKALKPLADKLRPWYTGEDS